MDIDLLETRLCYSCGKRLAIHAGVCVVCQEKTDLAIKEFLTRRFKKWTK